MFLLFTARFAQDAEGAERFFILLFVEGTKSKKQTASGNYGADYKPHPLIAILETLEAEFIIFIAVIQKAQVRQP